jgi:hypothetical protein
MTRTRIRDSRSSSDEERQFYMQTYPSGYHHTVWPDHIERVAASVQFINTWVTEGGLIVDSIADLSSGDGTIPRELLVLTGAKRLVLGDINRQEGLHIVGPLPDTLEALTPGVDLYVCSETIEHMDDPDFLLQQLRLKSRYLFISTPVSEPLHYGNTEHYWSWSVEDVGQMLIEADWTPVDHLVFTPESNQTYTFQFWMCT